MTRDDFHVGYGWDPDGTSRDYAAEREASFAESGGYEEVGFVTDEGDWPRLAADPDILKEMMQKHVHNPVWRGQHIEVTERVIRLTRALSIITGWAVDSILDKLLIAITTKLNTAVEGKTTWEAQRDRGAQKILRDGICETAFWVSNLNHWYRLAQRQGQWELMAAMATELHFDELPEEAMVGEAFLLWRHDGVVYTSAMINGAVYDADETARLGDYFHWVVLDRSK